MNIDESVWDIPIQTKTKLAILENYLNAWATVLKETGDVLYYVDGFAGPGSYRDPKTKQRVPGSPIRAIKIYQKHKQEKKWKYELRFINVEKDVNIFEELEEQTGKFKKKFYIKNLSGEFLDKIDDIIGEIENNHTFFFIDPFGISGIDFDKLLQVFKRRKTEIFLNFNYNGLQRCLGELKNLNHKDDKIRNLAVKTIDRVSQMLGLGIEELKSLHGLIEIDPQKERWILKTYRSNLTEHKRFPYPFKNKFPGSERTFYYLFFMTDNIVGLKIMKDIMYKERDKEISQLFLFPKTDISKLKDKLANRYTGQRLPYNKILEQWLPKCEYIDDEDYLERDVKKALGVLEEEGKVEKIQKPGYKRPLYRFLN